MSSVNIVQEHLRAEGEKVNIKRFFLCLLLLTFVVVVALARKGEFSFELPMHWRTSWSKCQSTRTVECVWMESTAGTHTATIYTCPFPTLVHSLSQTQLLLSKYVCEHTYVCICATEEHLQEASNSDPKDKAYPGRLEVCGILFGFFSFQTASQDDKSFFLFSHLSRAFITLYMCVYIDIYISMFTLLSLS